MRLRSLSDLAATLGRERDHLLGVVAALQLLPQNATKWARFERLLEVLSSVDPAQEQRRISNARLRQLLTTPPVATSQVVTGEDPFEESFVATVSFYGGSYRVVAGGTAGAHAGCQLLLEAVRRLDDARYEDYKRDVFGEATVLLTLSEAMCERAGLQRWELPAHSPRTALLVPPPTELERLCSAVSFSPQDLSALLGPAIDRVPPLLDPGRVDLIDHDHESPTDDRIYLHPLVGSSDGTLIVALSSGLAASITHRALARAVDCGLTEPLVSALHKSLQRAMRKYLHRVRWVQVSAPPQLDEPGSFSEAFYQFDVDKIAHVVGLVDPLENYVAGKPFSPTDFRAMQDELHARFLAVRDAVRAATPEASILHVVASAQLGRSSFIGFTHQATGGRSALLVATADDLDVMTRLESPDPLGLWKFAVASGRLHQEARVLSFSSLDEYAIYRDHRQGFYLSDDRRPNVVSIAPGSGGALRAQERLRLDQHAAVLPAQDSVVDVSRWPADDGSPVYRPDDPRFTSLHLVEVGGPCWVVPNPQSPGEEEPSDDLAEAIAFWLWRCGDLIALPLAVVLKEHRELIVTVRFVAQSNAPGSKDLEPLSRWVRCGVAHGRGRVSLTLFDGAASRLSGPTNAAERSIAIALVEAVHQLAGEDPRGVRQQVTDAIPLGPMKMFQVFEADDDLLMTLGPTAAPRLIPAADVEVLLDDIGLVTTQVLGLPEGPIPSTDRTEVLNEIVSELFSRLKGLLLEVDPDGLLEHLAAEQEAISFMEARNRLLVPSQAACFGEGASAVRHAIESARDVTSTAIASRFILECTTALSPQGSRALSVGLYDHLLAVAKQIVEYGYLSDAIRYGLSSAQLSILPSGRLGVSRAEPYHEALRAYAKLLSDRSLNEAQRGFARHWAKTVDAGERFDPTQMNDAFDSEFGVTATEMSQISGELMELARGEPRQIARQSINHLTSDLARNLGLPPENVGAALALMTLGPVDPFPPAANPADCFPWRFSRDRSAVRRPLLLRKGSIGDREIIWGPRSVYRSGRYLLDQILSDRLKTRTERMRNYVTVNRQAANAEFNRDVARFYRRSGHNDVRENVKRVGQLRLTRANGDDIGDVDVLVINPMTKVLLAIEAKDFEFARTPFELSNEIAKLLDGPASAAHHHQERLTFLKTHLGRVLAELRLPGLAKEWQIRGEIVTSNDLMAAHFPAVERRGKGLAIISFEALVARDPRLLTARSKADPSKRSDRRRKRRRQR